MHSSTHCSILIESSIWIYNFNKVNYCFRKLYPINELSVCFNHTSHVNNIVKSSLMQNKIPLLLLIIHCYFHTHHPNYFCLYYYFYSHLPVKGKKF